MALTDFDPAQWSPIHCYALPSGDDPGYGMDYYRELVASPKFQRNPHGGCQLCGTFFNYGEIWSGPGGRLISVGWQCAEKFGMMGDRREVEQYRKELARKRAQSRKRGRERARRREFLRGLDPAVLSEFVQVVRGARRLDWFVADIWRRPVSERQIEAAIKSGRRTIEREAQKKIPVPEVNGRVEIEGEVISLKRDDWDNLRMTVRVGEIESGYYLLWGTAPGSILGTDTGLVGRRVRFLASVKRGDRDESFGFFKRPTKASLVE